MKKRQIFLVFFLAGTAAIIQGCVAAAIGAGAGAVAYVRGDLEAFEAENLNTVYKAAERTIEQLELNVIEKTKDALSVTIVTRDAENKRIRIKLKAMTENTTKISIRIGWFGEETKSRLIYDKIKVNL